MIKSLVLRVSAMVRPFEESVLIFIIYAAASVLNPKRLKAHAAVTAPEGRSRIFGPLP
jgi:hypothetical protein